MKKNLFITLIALAGFVGCETVDPEGTEPKDEITYEGVTYKTVTLDNGQTWMAENLRFIPEGQTVSENPAEGNIWYPAKPEVGQALTDEASVKTFGYLYNYYSALNIDKAKVQKFVSDHAAAIDAKDQAKADGIEKELAKYMASFEGAQGICPEGWHVPTSVELRDLVGGKIVFDTEENKTAPFYDEKYGKGKITVANELKFNFVFAGTVNKTSYAAAASYAKNVIGNPNHATKPWTCPVAEWNGKNAVTTLLGSTFYKNDVAKSTSKITNAKFYGAMSSFTATYTEGALSVLNTNIESGYSLRCIKNAK